MDNYYNILGLTQKANEEEIKSAYRKLVVKYHPDKTKGDKGLTEKFLKIQEAYDVLSDKIKKAKYDNKQPKTGSSGYKSGPAKSPAEEKSSILDAIKEISNLLKTYEKDRKKVSDSLESLDREISEMKEVIERLNKRLDILNSEQ